MLRGAAGGQEELCFTPRRRKGGSGCIIKRYLEDPRTPTAVTGHESASAELIFTRKLSARRHAGEGAMDDEIRYLHRLHLPRWISGAPGLEREENTMGEYRFYKADGTGTQGEYSASCQRRSLATVVERASSAGQMGFLSGPAIYNDSQIATANTPFWIHGDARPVQTLRRVGRVIVIICSHT
ncbi:hypothetical protein B0H19DRAFT_1077151 [Mycena capillaripes]|nr:hypothetical protein B0H19DRAFT_1077151 [Mycena capillaripes]